MTNMQNIRPSAHKPVMRIPDVANILIIDDDQVDRARLRRMCEQLELTATITEVESLEAMRAALNKDTFDLIFLDYHLPDGNGTQALDTIQFHPRNQHAATIMVTGGVEAEIAINAMKNGCSDLLMKDDLSIASVRRAAINAMQKAGLNRNLEVQKVMLSEVERVIDRFANDCATEIKPMVVKMMRHVRDLSSARSDDQQFFGTIEKITKTCDRLLEFMDDIEDHERKSLVLSWLARESDAVPTVNQKRIPNGSKGKLFGRFSAKTAQR